MTPDLREQILALLKSKGPLVPNDIKKVLKGDTMIIGAVVSELSSRGLVKISDLKKGGSPFYYVPGQEAKLEGLMEFLNPKDQETVKFLKEQKVVQDKALELFQRVSLRKIKDFSKEMTVNTSAGSLLFWRYYLINEGEALQILKDKYNKPKSPAPEELKKAIQEEVKAHKEETQKEIQQPEKIVEEKQVYTNKIPKEKPVLISKKQDAKLDLQQQLTTSPGLEKTPFYDRVWEFFSENNIDVLEEGMLSKDREYEFVVVVPSAIGTIKYYCRARNKKKLNEGDVAPALLKSKQKDMQCLFLTNGEFTKKSLGLINKEYSGILIKQF